jgi:transcription elongation factor Elf1
MIDFITHNCPACGEQFVVACESQLQEKLKAHLEHCIPKGCRSKKRERTEQLQQQRIDLFVHDVATDRIHQHNFDQLVNQGMIVNA